MSREWTKSDLLTADALVKTGPGYLKTLYISWRGMTAGEFCSIIDGTTIAGSDLFPIHVGAAHGHDIIDFGEPGIPFTTGLFWNKGGTTGNVYARAIFK